jgi:outer membrane cobalamin receptor
MPKNIRMNVLDAALLAAFPACVPALAVAQTTTTPSATSDLSAVVISATSQAQPIQDVQASVEVISAKDLAAYAGTSVPEALKMATGVDARANGSNNFVAIRGLISNAGSPVLLLVDGLRRTGKYGAPGLNLMGLEEVERVEIVRGPMSALYGADATAGVINIITKAPKPGQALGGSAQLTLGAIDGEQRDTALLGATVYAGTERTGHRLSVSQRQKDLFRYPGTAATTYDLSKLDETFVNYGESIQ